jgi:hypothetical protein
MTSQTTLHRHPIRGVIWGLVLGLGVTGLLMVFSIIELSILNLIIYTAAVTVAGLLWGLFAPPKKPKGTAPAGYAAPSAPTAASTPPPVATAASTPPPAAGSAEPMARMGDADSDDMGDDDMADSDPDDDEETAG